MFDFIDFSVIDVIDIIVVAILFYQVYRTVRGTAALAIFAGVFLIYLTWIVVRILGMELLSTLLGQIIGVGAIALIVVFQQEVRRYLLMLGQRSSSGRGLWRKIFTPRNIDIDTQLQEEIYEACVAMSASNTGALIVVERTTVLDVYMSTGDIINAVVSRRLIESVFFKNSPLHDGAMIIRGGRIAAARCILPTSDNPNIAAHMGLRHRAGIGVSENTDSLVIVVSEETGRISIVRNGVVHTLPKAEDLKNVFGEI